MAECSQSDIVTDSRTGLSGSPECQTGMRQKVETKIVSIDSGQERRFNDVQRSSRLLVGGRFGP